MTETSGPNRFVIEFPPFRFDPQRGQLFKDGRPVKLHPQPAKVLALLLERSSEVVTRDELRKAVWGEDTHVDFDLGLNSCVRQLRAALGDDAEEPRYVETVPRVGYRFVGNAEEDTPAPQARRGRRVSVLAAVTLSARRWTWVAFMPVALIAGLLVWRESRRPPAELHGGNGRSR